MPPFPRRPAHNTPAWAESTATFHIRIRADPASNLITPCIGDALLKSARFYHESERWNCRLFLLMPDHLHALLAFPFDRDMGEIVAAWKGYQDKHHAVHWQGNYFDHRIRNRQQLEEKDAYIRMNPVRKGLCRFPEDWPWVLSGI